MPPVTALNARASIAWAWAAVVTGLVVGQGTQDQAAAGHRAGAAGDAAYLVRTQTVDSRLVAAPGHSATGWHPGNGDNRTNASNHPKFNNGCASSYVEQELQAAAAKSFRSRSAAKAKHARMSSTVRPWSFASTSSARRARVICCVSASRIASPRDLYIRHSPCRGGTPI